MSQNQTLATLKASFAASNRVVVVLATHNTSDRPAALGLALALDPAVLTGIAQNQAHMDAMSCTKAFFSNPLSYQWLKEPVVKDGSEEGDDDSEGFFMPELVLFGGNAELWLQEEDGNGDGNGGNQTAPILLDTLWAMVRNAKSLDSDLVVRDPETGIFVYSQYKGTAKQLLETLNAVGYSTEG